MVVLIGEFACVVIFQLFLSYLSLSLSLSLYIYIYIYTHRLSTKPDVASVQPIYTQSKTGEYMTVHAHCHHHLRPSSHFLLLPLFIFFLSFQVSSVLGRQYSRLNQPNLSD